MNNAERVLSANVRERLDKHLDAIERVLAEAGVPRSERRSICDEVEAQACEMVWERAAGEPTEQHMRAVLAELDDPEAYREAAEPGGQARGVSGPVADCKVHSFALWAFLLPAAGVLLVFSPFRPQGEGPTFIWFGVLTFLSFVFATLAIRDIRREPNRYFGTALAIFGALAIPLLIFNTVVIFGVSEINPFSRAIVKQELLRNHDRMEQALRQAHIEHHGPDVPFALPKSDLMMSRMEKWVAESAPMLSLLTDVAVIGSSLFFSILLLVWLYRRCRPKEHAMATGPRVGST